MRTAAFRSTPAGIGPVPDLIASTIACFMECYVFVIAIFNSSHHQNTHRIYFFFEKKKEKEAEKDKRVRGG